MKRNILLSGIAVVAFAVAATAHEGVKNQVVKARMDGMAKLASNMKILGQMAKGVIEFDADQAQQAALGISEEAAKIPVLFEADETDPKSEALPVIWESYSDFIAKSDALVNVATDISKSITEKTDLVPAMASIGGSCSACHKVYRQ